VDRLRVENLKTKETQELRTDGIFIFVGMVPRTELLKDVVLLDKWGCVETGDDRAEVRASDRTRRDRPVGSRRTRLGYLYQDGAALTGIAEPHSLKIVSERNHQGLANSLIDGDTHAAAGNGAVACRERLGGLLKFYHREAA